MNLLNNATLVGFDTETTGVDIFNDRIVTASLVVRAPGASDQVRSWLLNPSIAISEAATAVNGITTEHAVEHGADAATGVDDIATILAGHISAGHVLVAFNGVFDFSILEAELKRHGLPPLHERTQAPLRLLDPSVLDRAFDKYRRGSRKLIDVCSAYGISVDTDSLHDATADVQATLNLLPAVLGRYATHAAQRDFRSIAEFQKVSHHSWIVGLASHHRKQGRDTSAMSPVWPVRYA